MNLKTMIAGAGMVLGALALSAGLALAQDAAAPAAAAAAAAAASAEAAAPPAATAAVAPAPAAAPAQTGRIAAPPEGKAQIVFFRPSRFVGGALTFTIRENGTDLGRLPNGSYFVHVADPGIHEFEIGRNDTMRMEVEAGETYYVNSRASWGVAAGRGNVAPSDQPMFDGLPNLRNSAAH
jgi:hypothetical protein